MKTNVWWTGLAALALAGCEKQEEVPRATVAEQEESPAEPAGEVLIEPLAPEAPPLPEAEEEAEGNPTVGERVEP